MIHRAILVVALGLVCTTVSQAFRNVISHIGVARRGLSLQMSDGVDPLEAIRAKMASDPSYNPMSDPQAMQVLESMIPQEMKDLPNAVERLKVSFTDATTGQDAIEDLNAVAKEFEGEKSNLLSSPSSKFMSSGSPAPSDFDEKEKANLFKKLREEYPDVPPPGSE